MTELFVGLCAGVVGYMLTTFVMEPVVRYRDVRHLVVRDLVLYAAAIMDERGADPMVDERRRVNRERSAELQAVIVRLPRFYRAYLKMVGENPEVAASDLMGLSNATERDSAYKRIESLRNSLRVPRIA